MQKMNFLSKFLQGDALSTTTILLVSVDITVKIIVKKTQFLLLSGSKDMCVSMSETVNPHR